MSNWFQKTTQGAKTFSHITDFPDGCIGFIYRITNISTGKFYIGKKIINNTTNIRMGKKEKAKIAEDIVGKGRRPSKKKVIKESNWATYWGSSKQLLEDIKQLGEDAFIREIIHYCYNKKQLSYYEMKYQIIYKVLEHPEYSYNENIAGKFFVKDLLR